MATTKKKISNLEQDLKMEAVASSLYLTDGDRQQRRRQRERALK